MNISTAAGHDGSQHMAMQKTNVNLRAEDLGADDFLVTNRWISRIFEGKTIKKYNHDKNTSGR